MFRYRAPFACRFVIRAGPLLGHRRELFRFDRELPSFGRDPFRRLLRGLTRVLFRVFRPVFGRGALFGYRDRLLCRCVIRAGPLLRHGGRSFRRRLRCHGLRCHGLLCHRLLCDRLLRHRDRLLRHRLSGRRLPGGRARIFRRRLFVGRRRLVGPGAGLLRGLSRVSGQGVGSGSWRVDRRGAGTER
ncbi:hypothetical protein [Micromonospora sp. NPDC049679]|uniref:hypothetical protein n=1 Tax=Micromonospora sp. NPDC049679 TaxID=3155920 RepID=UPI0033E07297